MGLVFFNKILVVLDAVQIEADWVESINIDIIEIDQIPQRFTKSHLSCQ